MFPPDNGGGYSPPPIAALVQSVSVPPGGGFLLGPTPYITPLTPPHNSYQTVMPLEATAQVDDHLEGGVEMYTAMLDGAVVAGVTLGTDGILHIPLPASAEPGPHWIQVAVRDTYGNHNKGAPTSP